MLDLARQAHIVRYAPSGRRLFVGGYDGMVRAIDLTGEQPQELEPLAGLHGWVQALAVADDHVYAGDSWGNLAAWKNLEAPELAWQRAAAHDGWIRDLAIHPQGAQFATCGRDETVRIWDAARGELVRTLAGHAHDVACVAWHPDGLQLASGDARGRVRMWNAATGESLGECDAGSLYMLHRLQDVGGAKVLRFQPDGTLLAVAGTRPKGGGTVQGQPTILLFDVATRALKHTFTFGTENDCYVHDLHFHPAGFIAAVTSGTPGQGLFVLLRPADAEPFYSSNRLANCQSAALHPDGRRWVIAATNRGSNGNGRPLQDGAYKGNWSPLHFLESPPANAES